MEIIHLSAECYPIAKVGGLGDVVGALPKYQNKLGHVAKVVMPAYQTKFMQENEFEVVYDGWGKLGFRDFTVRIFREKTNKLGFDLFLVHIAGLLDRPQVYGYHDDTERFLAYQIAVLDWIAQWEHRPDVVHCHDHHTGLVPFMMAYCLQFRSLSQIPTVLTIHNAQYQGQFGWDKLHYIPAFDLWKSGQLDWKGSINPLASAIKCAWRVTTVSPSYLDEISFKANGLEDLLAQERGKSAGILNGIDNEVWNPQTDPMLEKKFTLRTVDAGKKINKAALCAVFNLDPEKPLFTFIGRLVGEKGADLLPDIFYNALLTYNKEINVLVLGSGDPQVEGRLSHLKEAFPGNYNVYIGYNEQLSHQIYAAADFLLMPSRVEPCGLNQMYALRYGTIPIVRRIGGLKDTVIDIGDGGFGICHDQTSVWDVGHAIGRAYELYSDEKKVKEIRKFMMQLDHSWDRAAQQYIDLYQI
ncbi:MULTISPECIES: glycogen synthase [Pedobacter]|uniref:Glycogen synthase n=1 Tax=Pedobacter heparinus (strain ATCC 13125 / DSM 2366 / CIP 104194 / JCM 7457 / NBRC 12017 / NCIMB 9290 / NRRL B-14731 / HIM 762-3) TaxID=485917 RepID=C6Y358_PEDHD|nr:MULTISPECIES: glycogen synthase [Pedobacter]ACU05283.1 glycogen/starch synthase, ADP-glucose type [Pedobacter heparinus DSM 2366]MBB5439583.1 starch synthase [Pedobacter sp. AK017]